MEEAKPEKSGGSKDSKKRVNFSKEELASVKKIVLKYPDIEKKQHDRKNENLKKDLWAKVTLEYNSEASNTKRTTDQIKGAWKRTKREYKTAKAAQMRKKFKTGGGPPSPDSVEEDPIMDDMLSDQMPLDGVPDDDFVAGTPGVSSGGLTIKSDAEQRFKNDDFARDSKCQDNLITVVQPRSESKKTAQKVLSHAQIFHNTRMEYLQQEQVKKMEVLETELQYWKTRLAYLESAHESRLPTRSTEEETCRLLSETI